MFYDYLNIDPYRYITLPSLCLNIYKERCLHDKSTVATDAHKQISKVFREWFINLNDSTMHREKPLFIEQHALDKEPKHGNQLIRYERDEPIECDEY